MKNNIETAKHIAKGRGGECLSKIYINNKTNMKWKCGEGHIWYATLSNIKNRKTWCKYCFTNNKRIYNINTANRTAQDKGGSCLSNNYKSSNERMIWRCKNNHTWRASLYYIMKDGWCPYCAGLKFEDGLKEAKQLAETKKGKCLSKKYTNVETKMLWVCENNHTWQTTLHQIKSGCWCPYCAGKRITIKDCIKLAQNKNGKCLSKEYINVNTKMLWECKSDINGMPN